MHIHVYMYKIYISIYVYMHTYAHLNKFMNTFLNVRIDICLFRYMYIEGKKVTTTFILKKVKIYAIQIFKLHVCL
jgi:hypothetical protein